MSPDADDLAQAAQALGLRLRGFVQLEAAERAGALADARTLALLGVAGAAEWPTFAASPEARSGSADPLDRWSRRIVDQLAGTFGARALFSFEGPPYWPFQAWAMRAEPVTPSPLGLLIHPRYGLWHSYRGALAFTQSFDAAPQTDAASPCVGCPAPCLSACPVGAFSGEGYDVAACAQWLAAPSGGECMSGGCLARRACPVGSGFRQGPEQAAFHMRAFRAARSQGGANRKTATDRAQPFS